MSLSPSDLSQPPRAIDSVELPTPYAPHDPVFLDGAAEALRSSTVVPAPPTEPGASRFERLAVALEAHPVHSCPRRELHLEAVREAASVDESITALARQLDRRSGTVARRFDAVCDLLSDLGCIDGWELTERGKRLARIYHECDLLVALALDEGAFDNLSVPELTALVSGIVYEERRSDGRTEASFPNNTTRRRFRRLERLSTEINRAERTRGLPLSRQPDPGFMTKAHGWASGSDLGPLIDDDDMSGGDFVRTTKMLIDVLGQLAQVAEDPQTRERADQAVQAIKRGVVGDAGPAAAAASSAPASPSVPSEP